MNIKNSLTLALPFLVLPLLALEGRDTEVSFHPGEGLNLTKDLSISTTFYLDDLSVTQNGQELPAEMFAQAMEEGLLIEAAIEVTDEYVKAGGGKVLELLRTYETLTLEAGPESGAETVDDFAKLESSTVQFKWDEEEQAYVKSYHESTGDDELLEELDVDMDFLALLPDGEVAVDDTWDVRAENLATIFLPGGMVVAPDTDAENAEEVMELVREEFETQLQDAFDEFVFHCKFVGTREEDGVELGEIEFKYESDVSVDLSQLIQDLIDMQAEDAGFEADITATLDFEFSGEGTLLWNLEAGHAASFEMGCEITVMLDADADVDAMGQQISMALSAEASGEAKWEMDVSNEDEQ